MNYSALILIWPSCWQRRRSWRTRNAGPVPCCWDTSKCSNSTPTKLPNCKWPVPLHWKVSNPSSWERLFTRRCPCSITPASRASSGTRLPAIEFGSIQLGPSFHVLRKPINIYFPYPSRFNLHKMAHRLVLISWNAGNFVLSLTFYFDPFQVLYRRYRRGTSYQNHRQRWNDSRKLRSHLQSKVTWTETPCVEGTLLVRLPVPSLHRELATWQ